MCWILNSPNSSGLASSLTRHTLISCTDGAHSYVETIYFSNYSIGMDPVYLEVKTGYIPKEQLDISSTKCFEL